MRLPTFLVIGAAKSGTTSLHQYLCQHPDVFLPAVKETNYYWSEAGAHGRRTPSSLADYARLFEPAGACRAVGEVSPQYLNSATAAERIRRDLPEVRLVVSLRNPADRAYSDYLGRVRILRESRPLDEAVRPGEPCFEWGFYHPRLRRYYARFPREQIHVVLHDDYARDTPATLRGVFGHLGVEPAIPIDTSTRHNSAALPRCNVLNRVLWSSIMATRRLVPAQQRGSGRAARLLAKTHRLAPSCPPALWRDLQARYHDDILATAEIIGRDLSAWLLPQGMG